MESYKENRTRGTADCPLSYYHQTEHRIGQLMAGVHWHPEFEIIHVLHGSVTIRVEAEELTVQENSIVFIHPNELHTINSHEIPCDYNAFVFSLELLSPLPSHFFSRDYLSPIRSGQLHFPRIITAKDNLYSEVAPMLNIITEADKNSHYYNLTVFSSMMQVFTKMSAIAGLNHELTETSLKRNEIVKECMNYLENNLEKTISLHELATQVHLHPNYLCRLFKAYTGQTVFQYLTQLRVNKACKLLRTTHLPVNEIALACGFESISFFTRKFKEIMHTTPKAYSKKP